MGCLTVNNFIEEKRKTKVMITIEIQGKKCFSGWALITF